MSKNLKGRPEGAHLLDYFRVLLKRLWLVVGVFVVVVGAVAFATWRATPLYRAVAVVTIQPPGGGVRLDARDVFQGAVNSQLFLNTQYRMIASRSTVEAMVERKGLKNWKEFQHLTEKEIVREILPNISVEPERDSTRVHVSVVDPRREIVHRIANELVQTFVEMQASAARTSLETLIKQVEDRQFNINSRIEVTRDQVRRILDTNDTDQSTFLEQFAYLGGRLRDQQKLVDDLTRDLNTRRPLRDQIDAVLRESANGEAVPSGIAPTAGRLEPLYGHAYVLRDPQIVLMEDELLLKQQQLGRIVAESGGDVRGRADVQELTAQIDSLRALRNRRADLLLIGYLQDFDNLQSQLKYHSEALTSIEEEFSALAATKREYDEQQQRIESWRSQLLQYDSMWETLSSRRADEIEPAKVSEPAVQPYFAFKPDKELNMILAIVFGLLGGMGLAFFLEYLDDTIKTKEELQRITDVPLFGVIPNIQSGRADSSKRDLFAYSQPKSTISEAFRGIRTAISYSSQKQENRVYLVTSSGPKEGKTTIAINVATVMAYSGTKTLIVDADLRRPRVHKSFDLPNTRGLTNLIIGDVAVEDVVQPTNIENLYVLPSGPIPPNPSELLGRERMLEILEDLRRRYDRVLLDTPPIGAVTDAAVLGRIVDSVILVVHAGKTRKKLIERGLEQLSQIDVDVSGVVLNNLKIGRKRYYPGYYHYYYYYSSYYGADEKPKSKDSTKQKA